MPEQPCSFLHAMALPFCKLSDVGLSIDNGYINEQVCSHNQIFSFQCIYYNKEHRTADNTEHFAKENHMQKQCESVIS